MQTLSSQLFTGFRRLCGFLAALAAGEAIAGPLDVPERYELRPLMQQTVAEEMQRCVGPAVEEGQLQAFLAEALSARVADLTQARQLGDPTADAVVVAAAGQWTCVPLSSEGFPIWPVETMHGLVVPVGVPPTLTAAWRRNLLAQVARDGVGRGIIVYPSGDADQVIVIAEQRQAATVKYSTRLLRAGEYSEQQFPAVLRHPGLSRLVTRSGGSGMGTPSRMAIPPHRLLQPVHDGFVQVESNEATRAFAFEGTRWEGGSAQGPIVLAAGGEVLSAGANTGTWRVSTGVLQLTLSNGSRYALTLRADGTQLSGVGRRVEESGHDDEGSEWQWPAQLRRIGAPSLGERSKFQQARWRVPTLQPWS
jgi:hypothetical protein